MTRPGALDWRERLRGLIAEAKEHAPDDPNTLPKPPDDATPPTHWTETTKENDE